MNKNRILLVDDDLLFLESLELFLSNDGFLIESIDKSSLIDESILSFSPDLIIFDIWLGDGDGRKICDEIKSNSHTAHIPIILITALSYEKISEFECDADAIIGKPYDGEMLMQNC